MKESEYKRQNILSEYNFIDEIIEFSNEIHQDRALFCCCKGGFGAVHVCMGRMIIGDFYPTLGDAINDTNGESGNTKAFPIAWWTKKK